MAARTTPPDPTDSGAKGAQKAHRRPRTRRRGRGSIQSYQTAAGKRWRYQIWVPIDPEQPDLGDKKFSRGGFATAADADATLQDALKQRDQQEKFGGKVPTGSTLEFITACTVCSSIASLPVVSESHASASFSKSGRLFGKLRLYMVKS